VPPKLAVERTVLSFHRQVSMRSAPSGGSLHREPQPLTGGPDVDRELPVATSCAEVREAEEVEGRRFALPLASEVLLGKSPEGDEPGLFLTQLQAVLGKPLPHHPGEALCILWILKTDNEVVGVAEEVNFPHASGASPPARPTDRGHDADRHSPSRG